MLAKVSSGAGAGGKGGYWAHVNFYTMWRATNCCALNDCCCCGCGCGCCRCHGRIQLCRQMRLATSANKPKSTQRQARLTPPPLSLPLFLSPSHPLLRCPITQRPHSSGPLSPLRLLCSRVNDSRQHVHVCEAALCAVVATVLCCAVLATCRCNR